MAARLIEYLGITEKDTVLDYGCAKGYLVNAFRLLHREAYGYDISDYAVANAHPDAIKYVSNTLSNFYDWIISKDVFEHIPYEDILNVMVDLSNRCRNMFVIVPLGMINDKGEKQYAVPAYELDKTHIIREDIGWWKNLFVKSGFDVANAVYEIKYLKENWAQFKSGNGFFILKSMKKRKYKKCY
jgi:hypothetical protein